MLNSRAIKFANISENKVLANNSGFTVMYVCIFLWLLLETLQQLVRTIFIVMHEMKQYFFMLPTSKKLRGHIGLSRSVGLSVRP